MTADSTSEGISRWSVRSKIPPVRSPCSCRTTTFSLTPTIELNGEKLPLRTGKQTDPRHPDELGYGMIDWQPES
jgi:hypothetical protein